MSRCSHSAPDFWVRAASLANRAKFEASSDGAIIMWPKIRRRRTTWQIGTARCGTHVRTPSEEHHGDFGCAEGGRFPAKPRPLVAQTGSLLYRGLATRRRTSKPPPPGFASALPIVNRRHSRLPVRATVAGGVRTGGRKGVVAFQFGYPRHTASASTTSKLTLAKVGVIRRRRATPPKEPAPSKNVNGCRNSAETDTEMTDANFTKRREF